MTPELYAILMKYQIKLAAIEAHHKYECSHGPDVGTLVYEQFMHLHDEFIQEWNAEIDRFNAKGRLI